MDVKLDDLFNVAEEEDADLFASSGASPSKSERASTSLSETGPQDVTQHNASAPGPRTVDRQLHFNTFYSSVHKSVVDRTAPVGIPHQTRSSAWLKLNLLANSPKDLERIMEMMPKRRSTGEPFPIGLAETFASESTASLLQSYSIRAQARLLLCSSRVTRVTFVCMTPLLFLFLIFHAC